jgi:stalled ribosome rescue protein Dom34
MSTHMAVWLDHGKARVFDLDIDPGRIDIQTFMDHRPVHHRHPLNANGAQAYPEDDQIFFGEVANMMNTAEFILIVGPSTAKLHLIKYIYQHKKALISKIVGVETVDHSTDQQIVAYAMNFFAQTDCLR